MLALYTSLRQLEGDPLLQTRARLPQQPKYLIDHVTLGWGRDPERSKGSEAACEGSEPALAPCKGLLSIKSDKGFGGAGNRGSTGNAAANCPMQQRVISSATG